jgi:hypothetical protein
VGDETASTTRRAAAVVAGAAALAGLVWLFMWWSSRPSQIGANEEVSEAVDALFTSVTARDEKLLAECQRRLVALKDSGKLPLPAATYLDNIINKARAGRWESSAQSLYDFVRAQRRDGAPSGRHGEMDKKF